MLSPMRIVCGLDVHKDSVFACILNDNGDKLEFKYGVLTPELEELHLQSPNQKIPDRKTKCVIETHLNIKQNVIFGANLKPV